MPFPAHPDGVFKAMYEGNSPGVRIRIKELIEQGWTMVEVEPSELKNFFEMKNWCTATAGELGPEWVNVNLRQFMFRRKDLAALFKLTFWGI